MTNIPIPINDIKRQYNQMKPLIDGAVTRVLSSGRYILGPEVEAFENEFATLCGTIYCVGVANGTDALEIGLKALGIMAGDEVITAANAGMYSTTAIRAINAIPVFADIDPITMTIDPKAADCAITSLTRAVIVTHLYGRMAHMNELKALTQQHQLALIEDCAQAHGAKFNGKQAGSWGDIGCFSFYPTKNLGALGDAGAIVTSDQHLAQRVRQLRQYGWVHKYEARLPFGRNSRLDEIQAAVLRTKMPYLDGWNQRRKQIAYLYDQGLKTTPLQLPTHADENEMIYHLYVIRSQWRDKLRECLSQRNIITEIHYPIPDHLQPVCVNYGGRSVSLHFTTQAASQVLSLPCFPELMDSEVTQVINTIQEITNEFL